VRVADFDRGTLALGDEIQLTARLRFARNYGDPGEFNYEAFMARAGVDAMMTAREKSFDTPAFRIVGHHASFPTAQIDAIRRRIAHFIDRNLNGDERAEMRALVIGDRGDIREGLRQQFARTGMAHLLIISGHHHLSMVAAAAFAPCGSR
jgi:competence protein ComEC